MWMKVDDGLHAHRKTRAVIKSDTDKARDAAPMGLWVLAGSWASQNATEGWVPRDELDRWDDDWHALADRLIHAGYWWPQERAGEAGFGFVDWHDYNDPADLASKAGTFGNHVRWHVNEGKVDPECEHCPSEPDRGEIAPDSGGDRGAISGGESPNPSGAIALPDPTRPLPDPSPVPIASAIAERRADAGRICDHLADRIEGNGAKRPNIGKAWLDAARLMLDNDGRTEEQIHAAIDWCQDDEFWRANILSLPKLREKYDQLSLQAKRRKAQTSGNRRDIDWDAAFARAAAKEAGQ